MPPPVTRIVPVALATLARGLGGAAPLPVVVPPRTPLIWKHKLVKGHGKNMIEVEIIINFHTTVHPGVPILTVVISARVFAFAHVIIITVSFTNIAQSILGRSRFTQHEMYTWRASCGWWLQCAPPSSTCWNHHHPRFSSSGPDSRGIVGQVAAVVLGVVEEAQLPAVVGAAHELAPAAGVAVMPPHVTRPVTVTLAILARGLGGCSTAGSCSFHPHTFLRYFVPRSPPAARKNVICVAAEPGHTGKYIWSRQSYGRELEQSRAIFICI